MLYIQKCWPSSFKLFTPVFKQLNLHSGCQSPKKPVISKTQWCRNPFSGWLIWFCINRRLKRDLKKYAFVQASTSYFLFLPPINLTLQGWWIKKIDLQRQVILSSQESILPGLWWNNSYSDQSASYEMSEMRTALKGIFFTLLWLDLVRGWFTNLLHW